MLEVLTMAPPPPRRMSAASPTIAVQCPRKFTARAESTGSDEFARPWARRDVQVGHMRTKTFQHPVVGPVTVSCDLLALTDRDQHLVLYSAPQGSPDADALPFLTVAGAGAEVPAEQGRGAVRVAAPRCMARLGAR